MIAKGVQLVVCFDVIKTDGTEDTSTTPTTRVCGDTGNWVATTNSPVRKTRPGGGASNSFHITLTAAEMNYDIVGLEVTGSGLVPRVWWIATESVYTATKAGYIDEPISAKRAVTLDASDVTGYLPADVVAISGDSVAADNLEAASDGTGYNLGGGQVVAASVTGDVGGNVVGSVGSVVSYGTLVADIWAYSTRTLTSFGSLVSDIASAVWSAATRTLTSYGTLVSDVAAAVWAAGTRTLTSFGTLADEVATAVWSATTRTLTSYGTLVSDIASAVWGATTRTLTSYGTLVTDVAAAVWAATTRTLTGFGGLVADIWSNATRSLTDKAGFSLTADYDAAKTAAQAGDAMTLTAGERTAIASQVNTTLSAEHGSGSWESGGGGAGSGARTVTVTVTDGTDPLEGARVRMTRNLESYVLSTDTNGQAVFNLDDGTWQLAVTLAGYQYSGSTVTVNGDESVAVVLAAVTILPSSDPRLANCYLYTYDAEGALAGGVAITFRLVTPPTGDAMSYPLDTFSETSDNAGLLQVELMLGATYAARRGSKGSWYEFTVDTDPYALPPILGYGA